MLNAAMNSVPAAMKASPVGFGVEALYHNVLTQDSSSQFITVAGRISFSFSDASQK